MNKYWANGDIDTKRGAQKLVFPKGDYNQSLKTGISNPRSEPIV
jgi:hypothetical protein